MHLHDRIARTPRQAYARTGGTWFSAGRTACMSGLMSGSLPKNQPRRKASRQAGLPLFGQRASGYVESEGESTATRSAGTASSCGASDRSYLFAAALRAGYDTEGQCCSGTHFPCTSSAPTAAPQTRQVWTAHCARSLFRVRTSCKSSLNRPSHGFTGSGMILLFKGLDAANLRSDGMKTIGKRRFRQFFGHTVNIAMGRYNRAVP